MEAEVGETSSSDVEALVTPSQPIQPSHPLGSGPALTAGPEAEPPGGQDTPGASDPVEQLAPGSPCNVAKKPKKTRRQEGTWNYTTAECVAVVWAAIAASEKGETHEQRLNSRIGEIYEQKVKELARSGFWKAPHTLASKGRLISTEESIACRRPYPTSLWGKARELRKEVQMHIAPKYAAVVEEGHSGWGMAEFVSATKRRYVSPTFSLQIAWLAFCLSICLSLCLLVFVCLHSQLTVCLYLCPSNCLTAAAKFLQLQPLSFPSLRLQKSAAAALPPCLTTAAKVCSCSPCPSPRCGCKSL